MTYRDPRFTHVNCRCFVAPAQPKGDTMKTIHKYIIGNGTSSVKMPQGAKILRVGGQSRRICLWASVDTERLDELRHFHAYGTGDDLPDACESNGFDRQGRDEALAHYLGTALSDDLEWHVFERRA